MGGGGQVACLPGPGGLSGRCWVSICGKVRLLPSEYTFPCSIIEPLGSYWECVLRFAPLIYCWKIQILFLHRLRSFLLLFFSDRPQLLPVGRLAPQTAAPRSSRLPPLRPQWVLLRPAERFLSLRLCLCAQRCAADLSVFIEPPSTVLTALTQRMLVKGKVTSLDL